MGSKDQDVLQFHADRLRLALRIALGLAMAGFFGWMELPSISPLAVGIAVVAVGLGLYDWRSTTTVVADYSARTLRIDNGTPLNLDAILEVSPAPGGTGGTGVGTLMVNLGNHRWIPIFCGHPATVEAIQDFVRAAKAKPRVSVKAPAPAPALAAAPMSPPRAQRPVIPPIPSWVYETQPDAPIAQRAQELASAIERVAGSWGGYGRVRCYFRERAATGETVPVPDGFMSYEQALAGLDRADDAPTGGPWLAIPEERVKALVASCIRFELEYAGVQMVREISEIFAERFISLFGEGASFFSAAPNTFLADKTFSEDGAAGRDASRVGMLWFESTNQTR